MVMKNNEKTKLKKILSQKLEEITKLKDNLKKNKNEDIKQMIKHYRNMTIEIEDRRTRLNNFNLQMLAISVTALAILISNSQKFINIQSGNILYYCTLSIIAVLIVSATLSLLFFAQQSSFKYPFLELKEFGNKWKWFYRGNEEILKINVNPFFKKNWSNSLKPYLKGLSIFLDHYEKEDINKEVIDNIQQLYLLQVHNYYKNQFYLQLTNIWKYSLYLIVLIIICGVVLCINSNKEYFLSFLQINSESQ